jgi:hypothetical protein
MKLWLQWSLATPADWVEIDLTPSGQGAQRWRQLPRKPEPTGAETLDDQPGWLYDFACQGIWLGGCDHYSAAPLPDGGIRTIGWNDDPEDFPPGTRWARVYDFAGGEWRHEKTYFCEPDADPLALGEHVTSTGQPVRFRPWSEFTAPAANVTIHGVWLPDGLARAHAEVRRVPDYREWR